MRRVIGANLKTGLLWCAVSFIHCSVFSQAAQETISISTYYPVPYGVYRSLRLYPTNPAGFAGQDTSCSQEGEFFYSQNSAQAYICSAHGGASAAWLAVGRSDTLWTQSGTTLRPTDNAWNVVVGSTDHVAQSGYQLDVRGKLWAKNIYVTKAIRDCWGGCNCRTQIDYPAGTFSTTPTVSCAAYSDSVYGLDCAVFYKGSSVPSTKDHVVVEASSNDPNYNINDHTLTFFVVAIEP